MDSERCRSLAVKYVPRVCLCLALAPSLIAIALARNTVPITGDAPPGKQLAVSEFARPAADDPQGKTEDPRAAGSLGSYGLPSGGH